MVGQPAVHSSTIAQTCGGRAACIGLWRTFQCRVHNRCHHTEFLLATHQATGQDHRQPMHRVPEEQAPEQEGLWAAATHSGTGSPLGADHIGSGHGPANGLDAILVFVDRFTKMVHYAPTTKQLTAEGTPQSTSRALKSTKAAWDPMEARGAYTAASIASPCSGG